MFPHFFYFSCSFYLLVPDNTATDSALFYDSLPCTSKHTPSSAPPFFFLELKMCSHCSGQQTPIWWMPDTPVTAHSTQPQFAHVIQGNYKLFHVLFRQLKKFQLLHITKQNSQLNVWSCAVARTSNTSKAAAGPEAVGESRVWPWISLSSAPSLPALGSWD